MENAEKAVVNGKEKVIWAFLELIVTDAIETISVKNICKKAGISRGLFYTYYEGKYELLEEIERDLISGFLEIMIEIRRAGACRFYESMSSRDSSYFLKYFEYIRNHNRAFFALLCAYHQNGFSTRFMRAIMKTRMETRKVWGHDDSKINQTLALREEILSALYVSMFSSWLNSGMSLSEEDLSIFLIDLWQPISKFECQPIAL